MGRRSSNPAGVILIGLLGGIAWLFTEHLAWGIAAVAGLIFLIILIGLGAGPTNCELCGCALKRTRYEWEIKGEKKRVCPNCNRRLQSRKSKAAMDQLFAK